MRPFLEVESLSPEKSLVGPVIAQRDSDITLVEYVGAVKRARWTLAILVGVGLMAGAALGALLPRKYTATIVFAPVSQSQQGGQMDAISSIMAQFGALSSLAGLSGGESHRSQETIAVLKSYLITEKFISKNDLLPELFPDRWSASAKRWLASDSRRVPTLWDGARLFHKKIRAVEVDSKTGIVSMSITWRNPQEVASWANGLVAMTNQYLRAQAIREAQRNIAYLSSQALETNLVPVKEAIYELLETEIDKEMIARGTKEYAIKVLDPAQTPERPSSHGVAFWTVLGAAGGLSAGLLFLFLNLAWSRSTADIDAIGAE